MLTFFAARPALLGRAKLHTLLLGLLFLGLFLGRLAMPLVHVHGVEELSAAKKLLLNICLVHSQEQREELVLVLVHLGHDWHDDEERDQKTARRHKQEYKEHLLVVRRQHRCVVQDALCRLAH